MAQPPAAASEPRGSEPAAFPAGRAEDPQITPPSNSGDATAASGPRLPETPVQEQEAREQESEAEYVANVDEIQAASVEAFLSVDDKLLRPDSLTPADVADMEDSVEALRKYQGQVKNLKPPEKYRDQHELLATAVANLHGAAEVAYRLVTDPASATQSDYATYDLLVDRADTRLRRSNEILGRNYETIEKARGNGR